MTLRMRIRSGLAASALAYGMTALCALASALTLASSAPGEPLAEPVHVGELFTAVRLLDAAVASPVRYALVPSVLLLVAAPLVSVIWLRAQLMAASLPQHARAAAEAYPQALALHAIGLGASLGLTGVASLIAHGVSALLARSHDLRLQQSAALLAAAPFALGALCYAPSVADRAQLELARGTRTLRAALRAGVRGVDWRSCGLRAACQSAVAALALLAFLPRLWLGSDAWLSLLFATQLGALGQTAVRASWLAWLTERAEQAGRAPGPSPLPVSPTPESECPAPRATGSTTPTR